MAATAAVTDPDLLAELDAQFIAKGTPPPETPMAPQAAPVAAGAPVSDPALIAQLDRQFISQGTTGAPMGTEEDDMPETSALKAFIGRNSPSVTDTLASMTGLEQKQNAMVGGGGPRGLGLAEGALQLGGAAAKGVGDAAMVGLGAVTPQVVKDKAVEGIVASFEALQGTKAGAKAIEYAKQGGKKWEAFAKANPQTAKSIGAAVEIGLLTIPGPKGATLTTGKIGEKVGNSLKVQGIKSIGRVTKRRVEALGRMLADPLGDGKGKMEVGGALRTVRRKPTEWENLRNMEVAKVEGVDPKNIAADNHIAVRDAAEAARLKLEADITKAGNPKFDKDAIMDDLGREAEQVLDAPEMLSVKGNKPVQEWTNNLMQRALDLIDESDGTTLGLLQARRDFDNWVDLAAGGYDEGRITAKNYAATLVRNNMNRAVMESAPTVGVARSLQKQSHLLDASGRFADEAAKQGANSVERVIKGISSSVHVGPVGLKSIAGFLGLTGLAAAIGIPATATLGALGAALWRLPRAARSKILGKQLIGLGSKIKNAKGQPLKELTLQRALIIGMLEETRKEGMAATEDNPVHFLPEPDQ